MKLIKYIYLHKGASTDRHPRNESFVATKKQKNYIISNLKYTNIIKKIK